MRSVEASWEVFHENSKNSAFDLPFGQNARDSRARRAAPFATELYPSVALPETAVPVEIGLTTLLAQKGDAAHLAPASLPLPALATLLYCAYGVTGHRESMPGGLTRTVTSAGGVYPLEVLFHSRSVEGLEPGLYHYGPIRHRLHRLVDGDQTAAIASALVNRSLAVEATMFVFVVAAFPQLIDGFGERGYRYALIEAGHVAQNLTLAATGLGLSCVGIGDYFDRKVDALLRVDGVRHSTVYMAAIGVDATRSVGSADH